MEWFNDDEITWELRFFLTSISWYSRWYSWCDRRTDELKDWWTNGLSYRDAMMHLLSLVNLLWHLFARKYWFPLFFTKASPMDRRTDQRTDGPTDGRIDGRMDGRTDRPSYKDARTHLKRLWDTQARKKKRKLVPSFGFLRPKLTATGSFGCSPHGIMPKDSPPRIA